MRVDSVCLIAVGGDFHQLRLPLAIFSPFEYLGLLLAEGLLYLEG